MKDENLKFEELLDEISGIARALEDDDLSLEESIKRFERGTKLLNMAKKVLEKARTRIEILTEDGKKEVDPDEFLPKESGRTEGNDNNIPF